jgi:hypothetical protein
MTTGEDLAPMKKALLIVTGETTGLTVYIH